MKRTILAVVCSLVLFFVGTGAALADEYTVVIDVAGEPMTLTVEADSGLSVADIDIVSVKPVVSVVSEVVGEQYTVVRSANLRAGPGTSFDVAGSAKVGDVVTVVGSNADGSWHELDGGAWVAAFLVEAAGAKPAATATPRATVAPARSTSVAEYKAKINEISLAYGDAFSGIGELFTLAGQDPSVIFTNEWILSGAAQIAIIRSQGTALRALDPPSQYAEVHRVLLVAATHFDTATVLITEGVDNLDAQKLSEANRQMLLGVSYIQDATSLFD